MRKFKISVVFRVLVAFTTQTIPDSLQKDQVAELDALYIIITENAKIAEIKENQEKLLAYGVNLIFEDLQYNNENKIEVLKTVMHVDKTFGSANWTKEKQGFKSLILYKDWRNQSLGAGFSEELLDVVENRPENSKVFVIGGNDIAQTMAQLKVAARKKKKDLLAKQQKLQTDPAWKGEWFKESTNFSECSTHMLEKLKMEFLNSTKTTYTFRVNGIEWDETALEIPAESIGAYTIKDEGFALLNEQGFPSKKERKVTKREINIIRKAQSIPRAEPQETSLEEIYIILTEEASLEEIKEIQEELLDLGVRLSISDIKYNKENNRIERIRILFESDGNTHMVSWNKNEGAYNFLIVGRNRKTGTSFGGQGESILTQINATSPDAKLFILGKTNTQETIDFLEQKVVVNKQVYLNAQKALAKDPNWKGNSSTNAQEYLNITPEKIKELKSKIKEINPKKIQYTVDGIEWGSNALDLPIEKIEQIFWFERIFSKNDEQGKIISKISEELSISVRRKIKKTKQEKPNAKKGYQYFEECDCYVPKTFSPNGGENKFKVEGSNFDKNSKIEIYDKWGELIHKSEPYTNDWDGMITNEESIKEGTYFFIFQATLHSELAKGYIRIIDEEREIFTGFVHRPDTTHYIIIPCTAENFDQTKNFLRPSLFMLGGAAGKKRFSSIYLGSDKNKPIYIIRKFDNFEQAAHYTRQLEKLSGQPENLDFLPISQQNYRTLLKNKSLNDYKKFYQKLAKE